MVIGEVVGMTSLALDEYNCQLNRNMILSSRAHMEFIIAFIVFSI